MNADDMKWVNRCISDNKGEAGGTPQVVSGLLRLHEREDGQQRNPDHHAMGKGQSCRAAGLREASRLEIADIGLR
jgi:hypothetical protein